MNITVSEHRQIENEMIFRRSNEKVVEELDELDAAFEEEGHTDLVRDEDYLLHLKCECSDENCAERIPIRLSIYEKIHKNRDAYILKPDHQVETIEKVIKTKDDYIVVQKHKSIANPGYTLNETSVDNS